MRAPARRHSEFAESGRNVTSFPRSKEESHGGHFPPFPLGTPPHRVPVTGTISVIRFRQARPTLSLLPWSLDLGGVANAFPPCAAPPRPGPHRAVEAVDGSST